MNVGLITLGCTKNQVDSEMILGVFKRQGFNIVNQVEEADIIVTVTPSSKPVFDGNKVKKEKELIEKIKQSFKNEIGYYHKSLHDKIYNERCETERAKQKKTIKRRNSMRNYLENELKTEVGIINKLNFRMNCYRSESVKILNRISNIGASKSETKKKNKITNRPKSSLMI